MQLSMPTSRPVVVPLPAPVYRVAGSSLSIASARLSDFATQLGALESALRHPHLAAERPMRRDAVAGHLAAGVIASATEQALRAVKLLQHSPIAGTDAFANAVKGDVLTPLEALAELRAADVPNWDAGRAYAVGAAVRQVASAAGAWAAELVRRPTEVAPAIPRP